MADMPVVKPRDMHARLSEVASAHASIRDNIAEAAKERAAYYGDRDKQLNAQARLNGKVPT